MSSVGRFPDLVATWLFGARRTKFAERAVYIVLNFALILGLFYLLLNTVVYDWTGSLYRQGFHLNTALDNRIPFDPRWAIIYLYVFYPLSAATMAYFAFVEYRDGYALGLALVLINLTADLVYIVFPVTTDIYRAALLAHPLTGNHLASVMYGYFKSDPSFNCFPSLHASVAVICFYAWYRLARRKHSRALAIVAAGMGLVALGVMVSTLFVKQHYIADEIAELLLAWGAGAWAFGRHGAKAVEP